MYRVIRHYDRHGNGLDTREVPGFETIQTISWGCSSAGRARALQA